MAPAEYLYGLPEGIQEQLVRIARAAIGTDADEKEAGRMYLGLVTAHSAFGAHDLMLPAASMVSACGLILAAASEAAATTKRGA